MSVPEILVLETKEKSEFSCAYCRQSLTIMIRNVKDSVYKSNTFLECRNRTCERFDKMGTVLEHT